MIITCGRLQVNEILYCIRTYATLGSIIILSSSGQMYRIFGIVCTKMKSTDLSVCSLVMDYNKEGNTLLAAAWYRNLYEN